jgi:peptide deformylase
VPRARSVVVRCLDHLGQERTIRASGWYARILQHEIDHLLGTLYIDRMQPRTFSTLDNFGVVSKGRTAAELERLFAE